MKLRLWVSAATALCLLLVGCDENDPMDPPDTGVPVDTGPRPGRSRGRCSDRG